MCKMETSHVDCYELRHIKISILNLNKSTTGRASCQAYYATISSCVFHWITEDKIIKLNTQMYFFYKTSVAYEYYDLYINHSLLVLSS